MHYTAKHRPSLSRNFYVVPFSPWPFLISCSVFLMLFGLVQKMHGFANLGAFLGYSGFLGVITFSTHWWYILILESTERAFHTRAVQDGLKIAMLIFILSEVMFFFGFFWSFFQSSLAPTFYIGGVWPPKYLVTLNPWTFPLLNTFILLSSGATVTWAHQSLIAQSALFTQSREVVQPADISADEAYQILIQSFKLEPQDKSNLERPDNTYTTDIILSLSLTIMLAIIFTYIQNYEYQVTTFSIESIYGSVFFLLTGFHGLHVLCGTIFLLTFLIRYNLGQFTLLNSRTFIHFELAAWYWHFVDIVWIFLFIFLYWWGGR